MKPYRSKNRIPEDSRGEAFENRTSFQDGKESGRLIPIDAEEESPEEDDGRVISNIGSYGETTGEALEEKKRLEQKRKERVGWCECVPCGLCRSGVQIKRMRSDGTIYTAGVYCFQHDIMTGKWYTCEYAFYSKGLIRGVLEMTSVGSGALRPDDVEPEDWQRGLEYQRRHGDEMAAAADGDGSGDRPMPKRLMN